MLFCGSAAGGIPGGQQIRRKGWIAIRADVVSFLLANADRKRRLQFQVIFQCAPLLKGIKRASLVSVDEGGLRDLREIFEETKITYRILGSYRGRGLVLCFREKELEEYMNRPEIGRFLAVYDYCGEGIRDLLGRLSERVRGYVERGEEFPHEIGVFLDYPLEDVRGFIESGGKRSFLSGYWKVYDNPAKAQLLFWVYDRAKRSAVNEFLAGKSVREIAVW